MAVAGLNAETANSSTGVGGNFSFSYTISAGVNRLLAVGVATEGSTVVPTVKYGGVSLVQQVGTNINPGASSLYTYIFTLGEAGIASAVGTTLAVTVDGTNTSMSARSYSGVNQTTPISATKVDSTTASTPDPITTNSVVVPANGAAFTISGCGNATPASWANVTDLGSTLDTSSGLATGESFTAGTVNPKCTWTTQNRAIIASVAISPSTPTVNLLEVLESDQAQAIRPTKSRILGQATETETSWALTHTRARGLGQVTEADVAFYVIGPPQSIHLGEALETDAAQSLSYSRGRHLALVGEYDQATAFFLPGHGGLAVDLYKRRRRG